MCTWSARRSPSSILLSFCAANFRKTSPRCRRNSAYRVFLRHLGMNTTWYLHSHLVWLKLSNSSIDGTPFRVLGGSRFRVSSMDPGVDPRICQTFAASPAEPGELPFWFSCLLSLPWHRQLVL